MLIGIYVTSQKEKSMFTAAAAGAFSGAGTAIVSTASAIAAIMAFSAKIMSAAEECFAFSPGKNFFWLFIKAQAGRSISPFFKCAVVTNQIPVGNFFSAFTGNGDSVRDKIVSPSAVFAFAFMFHKVKSFS